jgi:hypothetical protein
VLARHHGVLGAKSWAGMTRNVTSDNWGGFAAGHPGTRFRYIQGTFFVPYLDCARSPGAFSGHWVGIDGLGSPTVEQDGIVAACRGTTPVYASWYEMFPRPPVYSSMRVRPGNTIFASVAYSARTHRFTLTLTNTTNGQSFTVAKRCPSGSVCRRSSVEAISEAPSGAHGPLPLADFRAESYTNVRATSQDGHRAGLRSRFWNTLSITTVSFGSGKLLDQPTSIYRGTAFGMYWMHSN